MGHGDENVMDSRELLEHFDTMIGGLRSDMKDNISDIKTMIGKHLDCCDKNMSAHDDRIKDLEADKNKRYGAYGFALALLSIITAFVGLYVALTGGS